MSDNRRVSPPRCLLVWVVATTALGALLAWVLDDLVAAQAAATGPGLATQPFDRMLVWVCSAAGLGCGAWLWSVTTVVVVEVTLHSRQPAGAGVPAVLRRCVLAACGVAILGVAIPAVATPGTPHLDHNGRTGRALVEGLPLPDRATSDRALGAIADPVQSRVVVVAPGDTLWAIARADLGATATDVTVAAHWRAIFALNGAVVGADPDFIRPNQRLTLPPAPL